MLIWLRVLKWQISPVTMFFLVSDGDLLIPSNVDSKQAGTVDVNHKPLSNHEQLIALRLFNSQPVLALQSSCSLLGNLAPNTFTFCTCPLHYLQILHYRCFI